MTLKPTTPPKPRLSIKAFLRKIGLTSTPIFLEFNKISDKYLPRYCLSNCEAENLINGRPIVFGWTIWEDKAYQFIEAEFHAVIKINGQLTDITPRIDGEEKIMFTQDISRSAKRINEKRWESWTSFKSIKGNVFEHSTPVIYEDTQNNKWV